MKQEIEPSHGDEVFTDPLTQNIVLQRRGIWKNYQPNRDLGIAPSLAEQLVAEDFPDHQIPPRFQFSHEYYQKIKDAKERMQAYRSIVVSSAVETGLEAEIQKDPWKFLHIPKNADAGYVRAAKIRLSQLWHPDKMDPRNPEKLKMIFQFSHDFPVSGYTWNSGLRS